MTVRIVSTTADSPYPELLVRLLAEESGQDLIEYALVAATIGLGTVAGVNGLASQIAKDMNLLLNGFDGALAGHF